MNAIYFVLKYKRISGIWNMSYLWVLFNSSCGTHPRVMHNDCSEIWSYKEIFNTQRWDDSLSAHTAKADIQHKGSKELTVIIQDYPEGRKKNPKIIFLLFKMWIFFPSLSLPSHQWTGGKTSASTRTPQD